MEISDKTIEQIEILSKLELSEEEKEQAKTDVAKMMKYIAILDELDTTGIQPVTHVFDVENVFRQDEVRAEDGQETILKNAPQQKNGCVKVPRTIG